MLARNAQHGHQAEPPLQEGFMRRRMPSVKLAFAVVSTVMVAFFVLGALGQNPPAQPGSSRVTALRLDSLNGLEMVNTKAEVTSYRGRKALHLAPPQNPAADRASMFALVNGTDFKDGTIEAEIAGVPITSMDETARGFVGLVFHMQNHGARAENIYIRPTNGRAEDQLRRNHSVQYESIPDFPWHRLRQEAPGVYE